MKLKIDLSELKRFIENQPEVIDLELEAISGKIYNDKEKINKAMTEVQRAIVKTLNESCTFQLDKREPDRLSKLIRSYTATPTLAPLWEIINKRVIMPALPKQWTERESPNVYKLITEGLPSDIIKLLCVKQLPVAYLTIAFRQLNIIKDAGNYIRIFDVEASQNELTTKCLSECSPFGKYRALNLYSRTERLTSAVKLSKAEIDKILFAVQFSADNRMKEDIADIKLLYQNFK